VSRIGVHSETCAELRKFVEPRVFTQTYPFTTFSGSGPPGVHRIEARSGREASEISTETKREFALDPGHRCVGIVTREPKQSVGERPEIPQANPQEIEKQDQGQDPGMKRA